MEETDGGKLRPTVPRGWMSHGLGTLPTVLGNPRSFQGSSVLWFCSLTPTKLVVLGEVCHSRPWPGKASQVPRRQSGSTPQWLSLGLQRQPRRVPRTIRVGTPPAPRAAGRGPGRDPQERERPGTALTSQGCGSRVHWLSFPLPASRRPPPGPLSAPLLAVRVPLARAPAPLPSGWKPGGGARRRKAEDKRRVSDPPCEGRARANHEQT